MSIAQPMQLLSGCLTARRRLPRKCTLRDPRAQQPHGQHLLSRGEPRARHRLHGLRALGRGILAATIKMLDAPLPKDRWREHPRFSPDYIGKNAALLAQLEKIAAAKKCAPARAALAWLPVQEANVVPIPGTRRRTFLEQNCAAVNVKLTKEEIDSLSRAFPLNATASTRYPETSRRIGVTLGLRR